MTLLSEKPHQGVLSRNPAPHQGIDERNSTAVLGLRASEHLNCIWPRYTGKERDTESGNDYMFARYYNSATGRFLSPDWDAKSSDPVPYAKLDDPQSLNGLFASSHGAGVVPSKWPKPRYQQRYYGYAGGLGPANVVEQIPKIQIARRRIQNFWIDMEGRVRDGGDHLDLAKVHRVLKSCAPLINQEAS